MAVQLHAVNEIGYSSGIETAVEKGTLPLLQDDSTQEVWARWDVTYRDVVVLDGENRIAGVVNLSNNSLANESTWNTLKSLLLEASGQGVGAEDTAGSPDTGL